MRHLPAAECSLSCFALVTRDLRSSLVALRPGPHRSHHRHMRSGAAVTVRMATMAAAALAAVVAAAVVVAGAAMAEESLETLILP